MKIYIVQHVSNDSAHINWLCCFDCVTKALRFIETAREALEKSPNDYIDGNNLYILEADATNFKLLTNNEIMGGVMSISEEGH